MQLFFLEMIKTIDLTKLKNIEDKVFLSYFKTAVKNKYIALSKARNKYKKTSVIVGKGKEDFIQLVDKNKTHYDDFSFMLFKDIKSALTEFEYEVIHAIYYDGLNASEISKLKNTSRQYLNQTKVKALEKLRSHLQIGGDINEN